MIIQKVKKQHIIESLRFDGSYHLSDGTLYLRKLRKMPHQELQSLCSDIFTAGRSKRIYTEKNKGFPYLSNSDVVKGNPLEGCKYNSKKYAFDEPSFLKEGMIVTGRVGAIGQTAYITSELEDNQVMGSDNIIRIVCKDKNISGYVYSFLTSKYGNTLINRLAAGGVQPYISEDMLKDIPIPILSAETQQQIHQLIVEASELRVEANRLLDEAQNKITSKLNFRKSTIYQKTSITDIITSHQKRFESQYHKSIGSNYRDRILNSDHILLRDASEDIFRPGIFKRNYVKQGVDFLGGADITKSIPDSDKKLSKRNTPNFDELTLKEDWILVTCGGTIGASVLVNSYLATKLASQHILRVIPKGIKTGYLFAFLSSEIGVKVIQSFTYGSVIPQIEPHHLELVPIPLLNDEIMNQIDSDVMRYKLNINEAILKENQAIALIEKEIDLWQVS
ncbi:MULTISPECIES: methylation-associated defense system restriction endonuclease subunit S MAD5 [Weeksellaceae]|uniref:methylation-associated defense system restriction endonuclease subunit S MAD5 n=1 Tax=Weeksellaceae TaxID=2762318 RepID=UPI001EE6CD35|nr:MULTISPECIES: restriction endonuclease subunit S [Weeksellaceae]MCT4033120.1 restriction endonuclease subunit S [Elizabethkingia anophelis]MCT4198831.1 restriction endonuclease subunit S [Elizabethkingia anophelis]MCT4227074.1 restriction endonuclease subunit S [Elizabethkingia anophelis]MCT4309517.1 restriction endonuclease subunit S [Elizabethkingia anophelis]MDV4116585.1 hypothetical protein [Elizabethkingia anophelis]